MRPDGRGARPLTRDPLARDSDPAWSPDGSRIAFVRRQPRLGAAVFLVGPDGRGLCRLTPFSVSAYTPAWAPDATRLAYVTGDGRGFGLELVNADGSGRRLLTPQRLDFNPAWSPDGSEIAYSREASLYLIRPDGSRLERLTSGMIDDNPAWRPLTS
jgi:Tol biopolymer transport system component